MSIYTKETHGPLSYHYVNNDIDRMQKQLARERIAKRDFNTGNALYLFDGKNWSINK